MVARKVTRRDGVDEEQVLVFTAAVIRGDVQKVC